MQKKTVFIVLGVLGILFGIGWLLGHAYAGKLTSAHAQSGLPDGNVLKEDLARENWVFEPADPAKLNTPGTAQTILSQDQVIDMANQEYPDLQSAPSLTGIAANLGRLNKPSLRASAQAGEKVDTTFLNPHLVWIVTYVGVTSQSVGAQGGPQATSNEFDVVMDAKTGKELMTFVWTR